jgi:hypothetical protein
MKMTGDGNQLIEARIALLDALEALSEHSESVILVGAQAIYLHTGKADIALAEFTKDSDLAVDTRSLGDDPLIEKAMQDAGFMINPRTKQPGAWVNAAGVPVDLMVPEGIAAGGGSRSVRIPPHSKTAVRRTLGLEAALIDSGLMTVAAFDGTDHRTAVVRVAGPAALLVAKLHKLGERSGTPDRLNDKDAHDIYRLLVATSTTGLAATLSILMDNSVSSATTITALAYLNQLFAASPDALGATMAGRAEEEIGEPDVVRVASHALAQDLIVALRI